MVEEKEVFILGAGFTRAFAPEAPLLVWDCDKKIDKKFDKFPLAKTILAFERSLSGGRIDVERLMSRLYGGMPYDQYRNERGELNLLLLDVLDSFLKNLKEAVQNENCRKEELGFLAEYCVENSIDCITFNYDDLYDEMLWSVKEIHNTPTTPIKYWHPDGGYGFFCKPASSLVGGLGQDKDSTSMLLLKLHGSINWRAALGNRKPYPAEALTHFESWYDNLKEGSGIGRSLQENKDIEQLLEINPLIVPPLHVKSALLEESVLRLIWFQAYESLESATRVTFIGYSLPRTDIASITLFREAIQSETNIKVVTFADSSEKRKDVREAYQKIFPSIDPKRDFEYGGALEWSKKLVSK